MSSVDVSGLSFTRSLRAGLCALSRRTGPVGQPGIKLTDQASAQICRWSSVTPVVSDHSTGTQPSDAVLVLDSVSRSFGSRPALTDLSLSVPRGSISVLLGPNGAGKTTAIRIITGALPPTSGKVRVFGHDPATDGESVRSRCGVVSAKPALYERLSGRDNMEYSAALYGLNPRTAPIDAAARRFGILPALADKVGGYSTGMKTRLALARAVLHNPDLLLLDEPTSGLDPESSVAVLDLVRSLACDGKTVVMCTHLLLEAEGLADHVVVMHDGTTVVGGAPDDLVHRFFPRSEVVVETLAQLRAEQLASLPGVVQFERGTDATDGTDATVRFEVESPAHIPALVAELVKRGAAVTAVSPFRPTLEDLYFASRGVARGQMIDVRTTPAASANPGTPTNQSGAAA